MLGCSVPQQEHSSMLIFDGHLDLAPNALQNNRDLQRLAGCLGDRGYTQQSIADILYNNWIALLQQAWSAKQPPDF